MKRHQLQERKGRARYLVELIICSVIVLDFILNEKKKKKENKRGNGKNTSNIILVEYFFTDVNNNV